MAEVEIVSTLIEVAVAEKEYFRLKALDGSGEARELKEARRVQLELREALKQREGAAAELRIRLEELDAERAQIAGRLERLESSARGASYRDQTQLEQESRAVASQLEAVEEAELEAMEEMESAETGEARATAELAVSVGELAAKILEHEEARRGLQEQLAAARDDLLRLVEGLPEDLRLRYRGRSAQGVVLAIVAHGVCGNCHLKLSEREASQLRSGATADCDQCGGWLVEGGL